jgi:DNA-binding HxlR family transcriptional regulator
MTAVRDEALRAGRRAQRRESADEGVSKKMLTQTLRGLERDGLVRRTVFPEVPVRVGYALTEAGRTLCEPLRALQEWAIAHLGEVAASQEAYDHPDRRSTSTY